MRALFIGSDRHFFQEGSEARERIRFLGAAFERLDIIVFARRSHGLTPQVLDGRVFLHPTNTRTRLGYVGAAMSIARRLPRPKVVSAQDAYECGLAGLLIARRLHVPLEIQLHIDPFDLHFLRESLMNVLRSLLARFLVRRVGTVRAVSERLAASARRHGACRVSVLPVFIDLARFAQAPESSLLRERYPGHSRYILMASRLVPQKDFDTALTAFMQLRAHDTDAVLVIVGDGPERDRIQKLVESLKLTECVHSEPWASDLAPYYRSADVFLLSSRYEGFGRTLLEAAVAGVPVVTTDVGIAGELLSDGEHALVVPVGDAAALATALERVCTDHALARALGERACAHARTALPERDAYREAFRTRLASTCESA